MMNKSTFFRINTARFSCNFPHLLQCTVHHTVYRISTLEEILCSLQDTSFLQFLAELDGASGRLIILSSTSGSRIPLHSGDRSHRPRGSNYHKQ